MPYIAKIKVTLRQSILDVQGKAVDHALKNLGYRTVESARIGKYIEVTIHESERSEAERVAHEISEKLLSNPVMENYSLELEPLA